MLRTSFIACYVQKTLVFLGMAGLRPPAEHSMAQQSSFQSLATPPASATELWSEKKAFNGGENKASSGGDNANVEERLKTRS